MERKSKFVWPLMNDNISISDRRALSDYILNPNSKLTHGENVRDFEFNWSNWLGVKHSVMVNSGASANDLTMLAFKYLYGTKDVVVPSLTWVSDIASIIHAGMKPIFCDIELETLAPNYLNLMSCVDSKNTVVFLTHILGIAALNETEILKLNEKALLVEDVCESHGTTIGNKKAGTFGLVSNFSFYFAHHMTTIEGGILSTNDSELYETFRMMRSHGLVREIDDSTYRERIIDNHQDLNSEFIFQFPAHNMRPTELNGILGNKQLERLDKNCERRSYNFQLFMNSLSTDKFFTKFRLEGNSNYGLIIMLNEPSFSLRDEVETSLKKLGIEFRRGLSGGGNQLRQPYLKNAKINNFNLADFPNTEHVHNFSWYIGNYPDLKESSILNLCKELNLI